MTDCLFTWDRTEGERKGESGSEEDGSPRGGGASVWKDNETAQRLRMGDLDSKAFCIIGLPIT